MSADFFKKQNFSNTAIVGSLLYKGGLSFIVFAKREVSFFPIKRKDYQNKGGGAEGGGEGCLGNHLFHII